MPDQEGVIYGGIFYVQDMVKNLVFVFLLVVVGEEHGRPLSLGNS